MLVKQTSWTPFKMPVQAAGSCQGDPRVSCSTGSSKSRAAWDGLHCAQTARGEMLCNGSAELETVQ